MHGAFIGHTVAFLSAGRCSQVSALPCSDGSWLEFDLRQGGQGVTENGAWSEMKRS